MAASTGVVVCPEMSPDARVHVFRRSLTMIEELEEMEVDAYVVVTDLYVIVLDTLLCAEDASAMMQTVQSELTGRQLLVINSHADWDHAWGNAYFTGEHAAPIIAHEHGLTRMRSIEAQKELEEFQQDYAFFHEVVLTPATLTFHSQLTILGGDLTIQLLPAPGHHRDHIAAWIPELRLLLAFDAVEKPLPCLENAAAVPQMFATLERFLALQPEHVLCSHGKTTSLNLVHENLAYLYEIKRRCQEFLQKWHPGEDEAKLGDAATLISYLFDEVVAGTTDLLDRTFYAGAHNENVRYVLQWLTGKI